MPVLFYENYSKVYYSPLYSLSTCVCAVLAVFTILLPFFAAFASESKKLFLIKISGQIFRLTTSNH